MHGCPPTSPACPSPSCGALVCQTAAPSLHSSAAPGFVALTSHFDNDYSDSSCSSPLPLPLPLPLPPPPPNTGDPSFRRWAQSSSRLATSSQTSWSVAKAGCCTSCGLLENPLIARKCFALSLDCYLTSSKYPYLGSDHSRSTTLVR